MEDERTVFDRHGKEYHILPSESLIECRPQNFNYFSDQEFKRESPELYFQNATQKEIAKGFSRDVFLQMAIKAKAGDTSAIREFNRLTLPKDGLHSYVKFDLPDEVETLGSKELRKVMWSMTKTLGKGKMPIDQFKQLFSLFSELVNITEVGELAEELEALKEKIADDNPGQETAPIVALNDYRGENWNEKFKPVPVDTVTIGKEAAKGSGIHHHIDEDI